MEIERKYLLHELPQNLEDCKRHEIEQAYINRKPTIRVRKSDNDYILTVKFKSQDKEDGVICNEEHETFLDEATYLHLLKKADGHIIRKTRYLIPLGELEYEKEGELRRTGLTAELDVFHDRLEGLRFAEVEFPCVEAARAFVPPEWFADNVSDDKRYSNGYLSEQ